MFRRFMVLVMAVLVSAGPALAVLTPEERLDDPQLEERARALSLEVRCMVCQNQSIDDSDAPLARDLRLLIRERVAAGDSDDEVLAFLVARYGEFVLMRPRMAPHTIVLWAAPFVLLGAGAAGLAIWLVRRRSQVQTAALSDAERRELSRILDEKQRAP